MTNFSKTKTFGKPAVRQIKGPGMNRGLMKGPSIRLPQPYKYQPPKSVAPKGSSAKGQTQSLLPEGAFSPLGKMLKSKRTK